MTHGFDVTEVNLAFEASLRRLSLQLEMYIALSLATVRASVVHVQASQYEGSITRGWLPDECDFPRPRRRYGTCSGLKLVYRRSKHTRMFKSYRRLAQLMDQICPKRLF